MVRATQNLSTKKISQLLPWGGVRIVGRFGTAALGLCVIHVPDSGRRCVLHRPSDETDRARACRLLGGPQLHLADSALAGGL